MPDQRYSDRDKARALAALAANDGNLAHTARQLGLPRTTLQRWAAGEGLSADVPALAAEERAGLAAALEAVAQQLTAALADKIPTASLAQTATALGIVIDKMHLLRGAGDAEERRGAVQLYLPANGRDDDDEEPPPPAGAAGGVLN